ncbi:cytochrome c oxidase subunit II [Futiania mangrovi]|uniref:Cytochrome c oxidase subunit 2 n=1 Tax=Futiania mangrovi TaxID=2959716 RepID=A0A9J6PBS6_9PROT|nr:cytochrome c oxidase subunit II [Futiania mangrovii]MCP1337612.1 cytochrome c oxidase subunit II [Futiania mangrovii]
MDRFGRRLFAGFLAGASALAAGAASAAEPKDWQLGFQDAATPVMEHIDALHNLLLPIITVVCILVLGLLIYVMVRFNSRANPTPSRTSHNTAIEVIWTVVPILILVVIAVPSLRLLYFQDVIPEPELTIKTTGYQWYWGYEYPDNGGFDFLSIMLTDDEAVEKGLPRKLATDTQVVVPVDTVVKLQVTAADVIHNWAMPAFGIKMDAVPGRLNETWFKAQREGTFYGQCSELCGVNHAFMPIMVKVVSKENFEKWAAAAQDDLEAANKLLAELEAAQPQKVAAAGKAD